MLVNPYMFSFKKDKTEMKISKFHLLKKSLAYQCIIQNKLTFKLTTLNFYLFIVDIVFYKEIRKSPRTNFCVNFFKHMQK